MATTSYAPYPNSNPTQYIQKHYTATLLSQIHRTNRSVLSNLTLSTPPPEGFPINLRGDTSLAQLAEIGANEPEIAWPFFNLLWRELTAPLPTISEPRPPILLGIDCLSHLMTETKYRSSDFKPIHAHDLSLVSHFISHLSGAKSLGPSGGMVLAATSESNSPRVDSLEFALKQLLARQAQQSALSSADGSQNSIPIPDPWKPLDPRVMEAMTGIPNGLVNETGDKKSAPFRGVEVQHVAGLSKAETRTLIEYFAKSGLLSDVVNETFVGRTWTFSGGGIVGEVEKAVMRLRAEVKKEVAV